MEVRYLEQTEANVPRADDWLTAGELARLKNMPFSKRRNDWRLGRWTAKTAVSAYLGLARDREAFRSLEIRAAPSGAPEAFLASQPAPVSISLSHSGGRGACALTEPGVAVGCDLEIIEPRADAFVADYFTRDEQAMVQRASAAERHWLVTLLWSAKESALKALRTGLRLDTRCLTVQVEDTDTGASGSWRPFSVRFRDDCEFRGYWRCCGDLLCAVAAGRPIEIKEIQL